MEYKRSFAGTNITNLHGIRDLRQRFEALAADESISRERYVITAGEETVEYGAVDEFLSSPILPRAEGGRFSIATEAKEIWVFWRSSAHEALRKVSVEVEGFDEGAALGLVWHAKACLGIEAAGPRPSPKWHGVPRSAFLAHAFDSAGQEVAAFVRELLELLDFAAVSGEPFAATGVSDKIKDRIRQQGIAVCIFTRRTPATKKGTNYSEWVRDEATFAAALGKPLFVLVEEGLGHIPGIHGDLEYIAFTRSDLARAAIKLLQGLREAGFALSPEPPRPDRAGFFSSLRLLFGGRRGGRNAS